MLYLGLLLLAAAVYLVFDALSINQRLVQHQLRRAAKYAIVDQRDKDMAKSAQERLLTPLVQRLSGLAVRLSPQSNRMLLARRLRAAGVSTSPQVFLAFKAGIPIAAITLGAICAFIGKPAFFPIGIVIAAFGWIGPDFVLRRKAATRRDEMGRRLPDTLDLLTVSVEAGLGFDSAIAKVCEKMSGPLIEELEIMTREIRIGETRRQALRNLAERVGSNEVASFSRSIIQAEELGTSLGRTLRVQAKDMRIKKQLAAEEKAMKAPVKMLFPTVMFIFPAMFIIILGPAFLNIMKSLGGI